MHSGSLGELSAARKIDCAGTALMELRATPPRSFSSRGAAAILLFVNAIDSRINATVWMTNEFRRDAAPRLDYGLPHGLLPV